jgi:Uma2 family endonuclease
MWMSPPERERIYTYADYLSSPENERMQIVAGVPYFQVAPSRKHQRVLTEIARQIANYLFNKQCEVYPGPFEVVLDPNDEFPNELDRRYVVEPDISIICDLEKLDDRGCKGAPDLIVEIISSSTARVDMIEKFAAYEQAGVKEYWIIEPEEKIVSVFSLGENNRFGRPALYTEEDKIEALVVDGLVIDLGIVFNY